MSLSYSGMPSRLYQIWYWKLADSDILQLRSMAGIWGPRSAAEILGIETGMTNSQRSVTDSGSIRRPTGLCGKTERSQHSTKLFCIRLIATAFESSIIIQPQSSSNDSNTKNTPQGV